MATDQQRHQQLFDHLVLADDEFADLGAYGHQSFVESCDQFTRVDRGRSKYFEQEVLGRAEMWRDLQCLQHMEARQGAVAGEPLGTGEAEMGRGRVL